MRPCPVTGGRIVFFCSARWKKSDSSIHTKEVGRGILPAETLDWDSGDSQLSQYTGQSLIGNIFPTCLFFTNHLLDLKQEQPHESKIRLVPADPPASPSCGETTSESHACGRLSMSHGTCTSPKQLEFWGLLPPGLTHQRVVSKGAKQATRYAVFFPSTRGAPFSQPYIQHQWRNPSSAIVFYQREASQDIFYLNTEHVLPLKAF